MWGFGCAGEGGDRGYDSDILQSVVQDASCTRPFGMEFLVKAQPSWTFGSMALRKAHTGASGIPLATAPPLEIGCTRGGNAVMRTKLSLPNPSFNISNHLPIKLLKHAEKDARLSSGGHRSSPCKCSCGDLGPHGCDDELDALSL